MGYTHYWRQKGDFSQPAWEKIVNDVKKLVEISKVPISKDYDTNKPAVFDENRIWFNGVGEDGHETFGITRVQGEIPSYQSSPEKGRFDFCKTAYKPYDLLVCATLLVAKHHAPEIIFVASDGSWEGDWEEARDFVEENLGINTTRCIFSE